MTLAPAALAEWIPRQRWFAAHSGAPALRIVSGWDLTSPDADATIRVHLVADAAVTPPLLYQVPIVTRTDAADLPGRIGPDASGRALVDAPHDPAFAAALIALLGGADAGTSSAGAHGVPLPGEPATPTDSPARVLTGEQSNTSIVVTAASGRPMICKLYRRLEPGVNPDVELTGALAADGCRRVPRALGQVEGRWPLTGGTATGTLAFAQEFFPAAEDAWRIACRAAAAADTDFTAVARGLGAATAEIHLRLARLEPTLPAAGRPRATIVAAWRRRLATAIDDVPQLAPLRERIEAVYAAAEAAPWPDLQRIHGDLHLGQVILVPGRGWVLLDFEGEPMRPLAERRQPDLALRDVAGMLRSFDYVRGHLRRSAPAASPDRVAAWVAAARTAFLDGYQETAGAPATGPVADALELDKAVYETTYEAGHRPLWLDIPLQAVRRLAG